MKTVDIMRRAGGSLRQAKARTLLTSLAIAVGAFTIMVSLAAGEGARQYADELIKSNVDPGSLFIVKDETITGGPQSQSALREYDPNEGTQGGVTVKQLTENDIQVLSKRSDIESVRPLYNVQATYITIEGYDKKYKSELSVYNPDVQSEKTAGTLPQLGTDIREGGVAVPASFATALKISENELVGKKLTLVAERAATALSSEEVTNIIATQGVAGLSQIAKTETKEVSLTIVAVVKPPKLSFTPNEAVQIPILQARALAEFATKDTDNYQKYFAATAKVKGDATPQDVKLSLEKQGYYPQTADDLQGVLFTIVNVITGIVAGFGVVALIASIFGIINTQYISVLERTSQIGLMKALGMRGRDVSRLFRYEAAWIGFLGGLIGVILAWVIGTALNPWIAEVLDLGEGTKLLIFTVQSGVLLIIGLMIIAVLAGYFPARKAAKLDPIEALRTE